LIITKPNFRLEGSLGYVLNRAAGRMKRAFDRRLSEHGLTTSQWNIMATIAEEEGLTQMELGRRSLFDRPTTTGILSRLEERGVVERRQSPTDSRARAVYFTAAGRALFATLPPLAASVNGIAIRNLSSTERDQLVSLLNKVADNFEEPHTG
jgi:DNA-binding MarR family transcriptional regulator